MSAAASDVAQLLDALAKGPSFAFRDVQPAEARRLVDELASTLDTPADPSIRVEQLSCPGPSGPLAARLYTVDDPRSQPILFVHGGGWVTGSLDSYDSFCGWLALRAGAPVVSLDYRLAPEVPFPGAYEDVLAAARWLAGGNAPVSGEDGFVIAGDSAGGNLAAAVTHQLVADHVPVKAQLLLYPVTDLVNRLPSYAERAEGFLLTRADMEYFIESYVPDPAERADPRCSPLLSSSFAGLPPLVTLTCGLYPLRDEGRAYAAACARAGVEVHLIEARDQIHGLATLRAAIPSGEIVLARVIDCLGLLS